MVVEGVEGRWMADFMSDMGIADCCACKWPPCAMMGVVGLGDGCRPLPCKLWLLLMTLLLLLASFSMESGIRFSSSSSSDAEFNNNSVNKQEKRIKTHS